MVIVDCQLESDSRLVKLSEVASNSWAELYGVAPGLLMAFYNDKEFLLSIVTSLSVALNVWVLFHS